MPNYSKKEYFILTEEHIKLLKEMYVGWSDIETGAPEIDPKRPYGNSNVAYDVIELLNWVDDEKLQDEEFLESNEFEELEEKAMKLHYETGEALQAILCDGSFEPGKFVSDEFNLKWKRVK